MQCNENLILNNKTVNLSIYFFYCRFNDKSTKEELETANEQLKKCTFEELRAM